jgi:hypothetical protein
MSFNKNGVVYYLKYKNFKRFRILVPNYSVKMKVNFFIFFFMLLNHYLSPTTI